MNILMITPWYRPTIGGVALYLEKLNKTLKDRGNNIKVLIPGEQDDITRSGSYDDVEIFSYNMRSLFSPKSYIKSLAAFIVYAGPAILKLRKFIRENKIDITFINYPSGYEFYFAILRRLFSTKYAVIIHGSEINLLPEEPWSTRFGVNMTIKAADGLVAVSANLLNRAQENLKKLPRLTRVIYMGIDKNWKDGKRGSYNIDGRYILTLAWATPVKGPDVVIRAFAKIKDKSPDIKLVMVGSGPMEDELRSLIAELSLSERVIRLGTLESDTLPPLFEKSLFGVIPSRQEGFGVVALEFQLMKKAVIASEVGGIPEFVTDNYNGILVQPDNIEMLADKLTLLLENPELCQKMGESGYQRVINSFTLEKTGEDYCDIIYGILGNKEQGQKDTKPSANI